MHGGDEYPEHRHAVEPPGQGSLGDTPVDDEGDGLLHLDQELEPLVMRTNPRHGAVDEHQVVVFGVLLAEVEQLEQDAAQGVNRRRPVWDGHDCHAVHQAESVFGQGEEDVVLALEVAVDGGGAVFDALGNLADRDVLIALGDEEVARGVEDGLPDRLALAFVAFLDSHVSCGRPGVG